MKSALKETEEIKERALYNIREVAYLLKVGRSTVLKLIQKKKLPAAKVGRQYRILGLYLLTYILNQTVPKEKIIPLKDGLKWAKRLEDITSRIETKTIPYSVEEVERDIREAVKEVRSARRGHRAFGH